ncbi:MAG TPA: cupin domain-containing protein [Jatrophihabitantaceae bacterium]|nr:cupin domain-containing protein [Jatrophihabitantaceae bacterium]
MTTDLNAVAQRHLDLAKKADAARSSETVLGGHESALRQTVITLANGAETSEHLNPGQASILVLSGEIEVRTETARSELSTGEFIEVPHDPHWVRALSDSALLLTAVPRAHIR